MWWDGVGQVGGVRSRRTESWEEGQGKQVGVLEGDAAGPAAVMPAGECFVAAIASIPCPYLVHTLSIALRTS